MGLISEVDGNVHERVVGSDKARRGEVVAGAGLRSNSHKMSKSCSRERVLVLDNGSRFIDGSSSKFFKFRNGNKQAKVNQVHGFCVLF